MQGYAEQVPVRDRWLIASYVRALQFSQNASVNDVPAERRGEFAATGAEAGAPHHALGRSFSSADEALTHKRQGTRQGKRPQGTRQRQKAEGKSAGD